MQINIIVKLVSFKLGKSWCPSIRKNIRRPWWYGNLKEGNWIPRQLSKYLSNCSKIAYKQSNSQAVKQSRQSSCQGSQAIKAVKMSMQSSCKGSQAVKAVVRLSRQSGCQGSQAVKAVQAVRLSRHSSCQSIQAVKAFKLSRQLSCQGSQAVKL